jgi:hypothetical protein
LTYERARVVLPTTIVLILAPGGTSLEFRLSSSPTPVRQLCGLSLNRDNSSLRSVFLQMRGGKNSQA